MRTRDTSLVVAAFLFSSGAADCAATRHHPRQRARRHRRCSLLDRAGRRDRRRPIHRRWHGRRDPEARGSSDDDDRSPRANGHPPASPTITFTMPAAGPGVDLSRARTMADVLSAIATRREAEPARRRHHDQQRLARGTAHGTPSAVSPGSGHSVARESGGRRPRRTRVHPELRSADEVARDEGDDPAARRTDHPRPGRGAERRVDRSRQGARPAAARPDAHDRIAHRAAQKAQRRGPHQHPVSRCVSRAVPVAAGDGTPRRADDPRESADAIRRRNGRRDARRDRRGEHQARRG